MAISPDDLLKAASSEFDIMYNNIMSDMAPGIDDYEKSVFFTDAEEEIVTDLYTGRNPLGLSFEETEELRKALSNLVVEATYDGKSVKLEDGKIKLDLSKEDLMYVLYESVSGDSFCGEAAITPVTWDDYWKTKRNPFRSPNKKRVLRLDLDGKHLLVGDFGKRGDFKITVVYLKRPEPIIFNNFSDIKINGQNNKSAGLLSNRLLYNVILNRAVARAKLAWESGQPNTDTQN